MTTSSGGKYREEHVLKRAAFVEEKLLQFSEAQKRKQRFIQQMVLIPIDALVYSKRVVAFTCLQKKKLQEESISPCNSGGKRIALKHATILS